jgi:hypothetical protein
MINSKTNDEYAKDELYNGLTENEGAKNETK